ncbi:helix-turn-helix domain-containing protein [Microbulbifer variabilis]|uniref:helix-turn-helix domain-containing protein n=1 Tax=Microbulbifer variabilis TaxID=266805 RepID=UPI001CFD3129|nr:helix-turn-helix transcriptional regulator [Microbulbifer variabilis]
MKIADTMHETRLSRNTVMLIDKETAQKIDTEALDTLCRLFQCDISDMLELTDEP